MSFLALFSFVFGVFSYQGDRTVDLTGNVVYNTNISVRVRLDEEPDSPATYFSTISEAVSSLSTDTVATIEVLRDIIETQTISISNGKQITIIPEKEDKIVKHNLNTSLLSISSGASLTIGSSTSDVNKVIFDAEGGSTTHSRGFISNRGTLKINQATFQNMGVTSGGHGGGVIDNYSNLEIAGGMFTNNTYPTGGVLYNRSDGVATISGGTFTNNTAAQSGGAVVANIGTATISGGTFTNNTLDGGQGSFVKHSGLSLTLNGGITTTGNIYLDSGKYITASTGLSVTNSTNSNKIDIVSQTTSIGTTVVERQSGTMDLTSLFTNNSLTNNILTTVNHASSLKIGANITLNASSGTGATSNGWAWNSTPKTFTKEYSTATIAQLPTNPTRAGYTFNGWWTAASSGTQISTSQAVSTNATYYAQWRTNITGVSFANATYNGSEQNAQDFITVTPVNATYEFVGTYKYTNAGTYEITVRGTGNYAGEVKVNWTISKASLTVTAVNKSSVYGDPLVALTYNTTGTNFNSELTIGITSTVKTDSPVGTYTITPSVTGSAIDNYNVTIVTGTYTITNKTVTFSWSGIEKTYNGQQQNPLLTASGLVSGDGVSVSVTPTGATDVGTYSFTASLTGAKASSYTISGSTTTSFEIVQKSITLTWNPSGAATYTYNGAAQGPSATLSGIEAVDAGKVTVSTTKATNEGSHTSTATLSSSRAGQYKVSNPTKAFTISKAGLTVTAVDKTSVYGDPLVALTYTTTGTNFNNELTIGITSTVKSDSSVGNYTITPSVTGSAIGNYNVTIVTGTYTITQATPTLTVSPTSVTLDGGGTRQITITSNTSDGNSISYSSSATGVATVNSSGLITAINRTTQGTATITVTVAATLNYKAASATVSVTVKAKVSTATLNAGSGASMVELSGWGISGQNYTKSVTYGSALGTLPAPTKQGYDFEGWWTGTSGGTQISSATTMPVSDTTWYAQWSARSDTAYKVEHYVMDTSGNYPTTATETENKTGITDSSLTLQNLRDTDLEVTGGIAYKEGKVGTSVVTTTTILPNGSRVIKLYYERSQYTLKLIPGAGIYAVTNGSESSFTEITKTYYFEKLVLIEAITNTGYSWVNWTGTKTIQDFTAMYTMTAQNATLTANAEVINYTISYTLNGGAVSPANPTSYTVNSAAFTLTNPTRAGYTFEGWTGTGISGSSTSVTVAKGSTGNREYVATWEVITYTISYTLNGGAVSPANPTSYTVNSTAFTLTNPTKTGYTFAGWTGTGISGSSTSVTVAKGSIGNRTYTATWEADKTVVSFNTVLNGGNSNSFTNVHLTYDNVYSNAVFPTGATKANYTFIGWYLSGNSTKIAGSDGKLVATLSSYTSSSKWISTLSTLTVYARYEREYTINFYSGNNPSTPTSTQSVKVYDTATSGSVSMPGSLTAITGWTVDGWRNDTTASSKQYNLGQSVSVSASTNFYGVYYSTITITYNANGGGGTTTATTSTKRYNSGGGASNLSRSVTLAANNFTAPSNFSFLAWGTSAAATSGTSAGGSENFTASATRFAVWRRQLSASFYQLKETTATTVTKYVYNGDSATTWTASAPVISTTNAGSFTTLHGWSTTSGGTTSAFASGASATLTNGASYYAVTKFNPILSYNNNGGGTTPSSQSNKTAYLSANKTSTPAVANAAYTLAAAITNRTGYTFSKWAAGSTGGTQYNAGASISISANITMYALWAANGIIIDPLPGGDAIIYDGTAQTPNLRVVDKVTGAVLTKDTDYTASYSNNVDAGTATMTVTGKGNYSGMGPASHNFTINTRALTISWSGLTKTYNGATQYPTATISASNMGIVSVGGVTDNVTVSRTGGMAVGTHTSTATLGGTRASNYHIGTAGTATLTINPVLTVNYYSRQAGNSTNIKITASGSGAAVTGGDSVALSSSATVTANYSSTAITVTVAKVASYYYYIRVGGIPTTSSDVDSTTYSFTPNANRSIDVYVYQRYTMTYYENGASSGTKPSTQYKIYGTSIDLATNSGNLKKTGYTFYGWNTNSSGTGTNYSAGETYTGNSNRSLYARWLANSYTVIYNGNGSTSGSMASQDVVYGQSFNLRSNTFKKDGYVFKGWATTSGGGVVYTNQQYVSNLTTEDFGLVDLWAVWESIFKFNFQAVDGGYYSVDGFADGVTGIKDLTGANTIPSSYGGFPVMMIGYGAFSGTGLTKVTIPNGIKYISAYSFANTSLTELSIPNSVVEIGTSAFSEVHSLKSVTFGTGVRTINSYAFAYFGGGSGEYISHIITARFMGATRPTYVGSDVFGSTWMAGLSSLQALIVPTSAYISTYQQRFTQYSSKVVAYGTTTITFNKQNGSGGSSSVSVAIGASMPSANAPTRSSYIFKGYYDATSGGTQYYSATMQGMRPWDKSGSTATLYARWEYDPSPRFIDTSEITFDISNYDPMDYSTFPPSPGREISGGSGTINYEVEIVENWASGDYRLHVMVSQAGSRLDFGLEIMYWRPADIMVYRVTVIRGGVRGNSINIVVVS